jgi:hypothetical protein
VASFSTVPKNKDVYTRVDSLEEEFMSETFPAANKKAVIDFGYDGPFGPFAAELSFNEADSTVTFLVTRGSMLDKTETCSYEASMITEGIWLVMWREADGLTVVQIQDFNTGRVTSGVTTPDHQLVQINGAISLL